MKKINFSAVGITVLWVVSFAHIFHNWTLGICMGIMFGIPFGLLDNDSDEEKRRKDMNNKKITGLASLAVCVASVLLIVADHFWIGLCILGGGTTLINTLTTKNKTESEKQA